MKWHDIADSQYAAENRHIAANRQFYAETESGASAYRSHERQRWEQHAHVDDTVCTRTAYGGTRAAPGQ